MTTPPADIGEPPRSASLDAQRLTSGRLLARNVVLNAAGWVVPMVLAFVAIPVLLHGLGEARYGVLTLAWTLVGYFSLFDLGMGRALTQLVSRAIGRGETDELPTLVWTALWLLVPLGVVGGLLIGGLAPLLAGAVLRIPPTLRAETVTAFRLLAIAIPFTVTTAGLRGVLEATQSFGVINVLRLPLALATFAGPMLVIPFAPTLTAAVAVLVVGRALVLAAHVVALRRVQRALGTVHRPRVRHLRPLVTLGGWMTVSNVVSPLMSSLDRFVVGAVLSVQAVAYYATSYEAVTRLWTITSVLLPVLFPAIAATADHASERAGRLIDRGMRASLVAAFPAAFVLGVFAPEWLGVWVGHGFAEHAAPLARILAAAVLVNVAGQVAYTAVQAAGRAESTGRLHLAELVPYAATLWVLLHTAGTTGVAWAWGARVAVDTAVLLHLARKYVPSCGPAMRHGGRLVSLGASLVLLAVWVPGLAWRVVYATAVLTVFCAYVWMRYLAPEERAMLRAVLQRWRRASPSGEAA